MSENRELERETVLNHREELRGESEVSRGKGRQLDSLVGSYP